MATVVIGVRFKHAGKLYYFDPGAYSPAAGEYVIVETARGVEFGEVVTSPRELPDEMIVVPLKPVLRIATPEDVMHQVENEKNEKEAYGVCQDKINDHKLDMKLVRVEYTFDNSKILFYFTANGRVDFRALVKDLASIFKTRIELRQIGVRDEAKMLGGLGPCGRTICCGSFLGDFQPVSIKMAKEQNLSLNPTKISGVCGRLMCCLKYEQDGYEQARKRMPKVGKEVTVPDGRGVVWDINVLKETVKVRIHKGDSSELKEYPADQVERLLPPGVQAAPRKDANAPDSAPSPDAQGETDVFVAMEADLPDGGKALVIEKEEAPREPRARAVPRPAPRERNTNRRAMEPPQTEKDNAANPIRQPAEKPPKKAPSAPVQEPAEAQPPVSPWQAAVASALAAAEEKSKPQTEVPADQSEA